MSRYTASDLQYIGEQEALADAQRVVLERYPDAWTLRDLVSREPYGVSDGEDRVIGVGNTELDAWVNAAEQIEDA